LARGLKSEGLREFAQTRRVSDSVPILALLLISTGVGLVWNGISGDKSAWSLMGRTQSPIAKSSETTSIADVSFVDLQKWLSQGGVLLVDARSTSEFQIEHLPGALNVPVDNGPEYLTEASERLRRDARAIVVYCSGVSCDDADRLAEQIRDLKLKQSLFIYRGGIEEWKANGGHL